MSNHVHFIGRCIETVAMADLMRDFKAYTSRAISIAIQETEEGRREWMLHRFRNHVHKTGRGEMFAVWQEGYHAVLLEDNAIIQQRLDYLHQNPVRAGWVDEPQHYKYSSAVDYCGGKGLLPVVLL